MAMDFNTFNSQTAEQFLANNDEDAVQENLSKLKNHRNRCDLYGFEQQITKFSSILSRTYFYFEGNGFRTQA